MPREIVLKIEHRKVFDKYAVRIVYQNDDILKREIFNDCDVKSISHIEYRDDVFYIRGNNRKNDNDVIIVDESQMQDIFEKVAKVNEKYGIIKRWRASEQNLYYTILSNGEVFSIVEKGSKEDNARYEIGNYFPSINDARRVLNSIQWKQFWNDVKEDKLKYE
mgnify:FL=1